MWLTWASRTVLALLEGSYALAEELMGHEMDPGHPTTPIQDDVSAARMHRWLLRREQARGTEEEASVRASAEEFPWYPLHRGALSCLLADAGRIDEARAVFDDLAVDEFRALYPDCEWLLGTALVSEACAALGDSSAAAVLYRQLLPFEGGHAVGHTEGSVGAVDRYLGMLAATLGQESDAERHFESGIAVNEKLGAVPFAAHTRADLAALLRRRGAPGDVQRATTLERMALQTARRLGMVALEGRLTGAADVVEPRSWASATDPATFQREGEYWTVAFNGRAVRMRDAKGMRYLARLLARPGEELHALDLARTGADQAATAAIPDGVEMRGDGLGDALPHLDAEAQAAYGDRLRELRPELDAAQEAGDGERAARLEAEIDIIVGELSAAFGLGGRARKEGSSAERARQSVTKAIRDALRRIREEDPALGEHLTRAVRTGIYCTYDPDPAGAPPTWRTDRRV